MIPSLPRRSPAVLAGALALSGLGACGGGDSHAKPTPKATPTPTPAISEQEFNALQLNTPRRVIEQRYGLPLENPRSRVSARYIRGEPKGYRCVFYPVANAPRADFLRFCYKGGTLQSKLAVTTVKKNGQGE
jgi:hypothetical protein